MGSLNDKLVISDLSKGYKEKEVLKSVSFTVKDGEFLSILGPSGCGKTTLLRLLIGLLKPDSGIVVKDGVDITNAAPDKRGMGIVFQNYALFENMNVLGNVEYALKINKQTRTGARDTARRMLAAVGLSDYERSMPKNLSGGQQQRVAIARTLALQPEELKKLQASFGTTMIYVTHDQEEAFALSDRIMIMDRGQISQIDTPVNICEEPANDYVKTFVLDNLRAKIDSLSRYAPGLRK